MRHYLAKNKKWLIPILLMAAITPFTPDLDFQISNYFYSKGTPTEPFDQSTVLKLIYIYGLVPGQITFILAAIGLLLSFVSATFKDWHKHFLFIVLTLAIGSGLITHAILKDHWGRPRPKQVIEFGGTQEFRPYFRPNLFNQTEPSKSFPSGHSTLGFYFFAFVFLGFRLEKKWLYYSGLFLALVLGAALSYTRIAQGGHFFSDVLMSALIMWLTAFVLDKIIYEEMA